jgi:hypothetical protein
MSIVIFWVVIPCSLVVGFQREVTSTLNMEAIRSSEMLVTTYKTARCHNPQDHNRHLHRRVIVKSRNKTYRSQVYNHILNSFID